MCLDMSLFSSVPLATYCSGILFSFSSRRFLSILFIPPSLLPLLLPCLIPILLIESHKVGFQQSKHPQKDRVEGRGTSAFSIQYFSLQPPVFSMVLPTSIVHGVAQSKHFCKGWQRRSGSLDSLVLSTSPPILSLPVISLPEVLCMPSFQVCQGFCSKWVCFFFNLPQCQTY